MIPLVPALALAFVSFLASAFVILRIIIPILPPHPLSRRVSPSEFGLPAFRSLSPADKAHVWLASLDIVAIAVFVWQVVAETSGGVSGFASASDPASSVRLWIILTIRQTFFFVVAGITLLHVRLGRPISFGAKHWVLWAPSLVLILTSTALSGIISGAGIPTLFYGLMAYNSTIAVLTTVGLGCIIGTLFVIQRNLTALNEEMEPWPPLREEAKPRPSFATEDIDALREGGSWISSNSSSSSHHNSISGWSFSTHHSANISSHGRPQSSTKSSYWSARENIPPVPPLPSGYSHSFSAPEEMSDPDPFRRDFPRERLGSQTSWLTSTNGSVATMSAWSFPASQSEASIRSVPVRDVHTPSTLTPSRPNTPAMSSAQVLGGYGSAPGDAEKGNSALATMPDATLDVSISRNLGWFLFILLPYTLSLPYLIIMSQNSPSSLAISILFILSITLSSPVLALNVLLKCPFPIPTGLFDVATNLPADLRGPKDSMQPKWSNDIKRSMSLSVTVVEGRRSGDVWLAKGDAVDGKGKFGRAFEVLNPCPKLSVLPSEEFQDVPLTPPLPMQEQDNSRPVTVHDTPSSEASAHHGRFSKASSHLSADENFAFASKIMTAQHHYSTLAQTVVLSPSRQDTQGHSGNEVTKATGAIVAKPRGHLRARSISSANAPETPTGGESFRVSPTPPPSFPLPPTPPNVRAARLAKLAHKKSFSSGFDFGPVDDMKQIDALTAGVLPLLIPGLKVGKDMKIVDDGDCSRNTNSKMNEFGLDFSSPQISSTPAKRSRNKKSGHRKSHCSLPSLGLGKDGVHSLATWGAEIRGAIDNKVKNNGQYMPVPSNVEVGWRNTVFGAEIIPNDVPHLHSVTEEDEFVQPARNGASLGRSISTRSLGLRVEIPHSTDSSRLSLLGMNPPLSAASSATLFEDIEADFTPVAESTPHNSVATKKPRKQPPPPLPLQDHKPNHRRSSIVYIKSCEDEHPVNITPPQAESTTISTMASIAQWSSRAVKPLIPKTGKLQRKNSDAKSGARGVALRPLSLLQDRNINIAAGPALNDTRPLALGKKFKPKKATPEIQDENAAPGVTRSNSNRSLKPLKLARSETNKMRGILRRNEVLPDVVIRPPSESYHNGYSYSFRND